MSRQDISTESGNLPSGAPLRPRLGQEVAQGGALHGGEKGKKGKGHVRSRPSEWSVPKTVWGPPPPLEVVEDDSCPHCNG